MPGVSVWRGDWGVGVNDFGVMTAEAEKFTRAGFLSYICIPKS